MHLTMTFQNLEVERDPEMRSVAFRGRAGGCVAQGPRSADGHLAAVIGTVSGYLE
jgi:hypothetical protein